MFDLRIHVRSSDCEVKSTVCHLVSQKGVLSVAETIDEQPHRHEYSCRLARQFVGIPSDEKAMAPPIGYGVYLLLSSSNKTI